jgi:probable F420-dependent oxidoreductase
MLVEIHLPDADWADLPTLAAAAESTGVDALAQAELARDPFVALAAYAHGTQRVELATSVAIAFPRSPMVVAYAARSLADLTGGRFTLGLGTQVKGHIERRFSTEWGAPGPRLREYVEALRAIWNTWDTGAPLRYAGKFYNFSLMTPEFSPPPSNFRPIRVEIAAVNDYNIQLAGELCDGLRAHPFATPAYMRDVIWPNVERGAARAGRSLDSFRMIGGGFIATGPDDEAVQAAREQARYRIAFYGSTRTYLPVLAHHGWEALNGELHQLVAQGRWGDIATTVPDEVLDEFCIAGTYDAIVERFRARMGGLTDMVTLSLPAGFPDGADAFAALVTGFRSVESARERRGASAT